MTNLLKDPLVLIPGSPEWHIVHEALDQFVENHADFIDTEDPSDARTAAVAKQALAAAVLNRFTAVFCALAETKEG